MDTSKTYYDDQLNFQMIPQGKLQTVRPIFSLLCPMFWSELHENM